MPVEIIPNEPDAGNAAVGKHNLKQATMAAPCIELNSYARFFVYGSICHRSVMYAGFIGSGDS